ncbi:MAG: hypothetical protein K0S01_3657 [Herbinix sp.]|jgi:hypothetical protein|nr:hypothetical protein [Herbinix sp.]
MKKLICIILTVTLLFTPTTFAFAKPNKVQEKNNRHTTHQQYDNHKEKHDEKKQDFKINGASVIKYGKYKIPISPITKGMGATVTYDKNTAILIVAKGSIKIVINFKKETVSVNGIVDGNAGIFSTSNKNKTTVLIKYIANVLGVRVCVDKDDVIVDVPGLNVPTNVTVKAVGTTVVANTLNSTTLYMNATANIIAGQATGGKAELYVGSKLVATDTYIASGDTVVTFTTSDNTPTNVELQTIVPNGGMVSVKLYNASNSVVTSAVANPTLVVDYVSPTITSITSAIYNATNNQLYLTVTGAGSIGDKVDVSKLLLYDYALGRTYQLTNTAGTGSYGVVSSSNSLVINIGSADRFALTGFGSTSIYLTVAAGSLLNDTAGNTSPSFTAIQTIPVTAGTGLNIPTNVTIIPYGSIVKANTLNSTTLSMTVTANITAGQATGGRAELYVGSKLVATDSYIAAGDTAVTFTTSDNTPTNSELQTAVPEGGLVTVRLYNTSNNYVISSSANPTLIVDYVAPTITAVTSAIYNVTDNRIYLIGSGISTIGDLVDVTKITLYASTLGRTYQLTNTSGTGSSGVVGSTNSLVINIGTTDRLGLSGFGSTTVYITVNVGPLLTDAAGNTSYSSTVVQTVPVSIIN